jgi:beta-galactosidase
MKNIQTGKKNASGMSNLESDYSDKQFGPLIEPYADQLDVCGYNYLDTRYEQDGKDYPNRIICGTESVPLDFARVWKNTMAFNYVIGDFVWTSQDYIGEAGIGQATYVTEEEAAKCNPIMGMPITYPWRTAASGNFDLCSHPTTALYLHQAAWGNKQTVIAVHNPANNGKVEKVSRYGWPECYHDWSFKGYEGQNVTVDVFSIGDQVELFVNKKSLGKKTAGEAVGFITKFDTVYQPGEIEAISYLKGQKLSSDLIKTVGEAVGLQFVSDKKELKADGQSLAFVDVYLVDNKGQPVVHQNLKATAVLEGEAGKLVAFGNGCPKTEENYTKGEFTSYRGYWQAVIRSENKLGSLTLKIKVDGLTDFSFQIEVK